MSAMAGGATNKIVGSASLNRVKRTLECRELSLAEGASSNAGNSHSHRPMSTI